jgi:putative ABC transport system permease protein
MNISNLFKIAINALRRNKFRAFLTMLGIIIGVASVIAMLAIGEGSKKSIQQQMSSMGTNLIQVMPSSMERGGVQLGNTNSESLKLKDITAIEKSCPDIVAISPELRASGQVVYGNGNWPTSIFGINDEYLNIKKYELASGRIFTENEIKTMGKVCLVGQTVVKNLFGENANPVGQTIRFDKIPMKIIGVLASKGDNSFGRDQDDIIMAPYTTVQKRMLAIDYIQGISMSAANEDKADEAITQVEDALRKSHKLTQSDSDDFRVFSQSELVSTFSSISNVLTALLGAIAGISLLVGGIGIMNIMYVSVTERTREIGLRMSIGGRGVDILMQFLIESVLLSVIGGIIGILLGYVASNLVGSIMGWPVYVMTSSVILSFLVCSAIGIFFGWYPARKAAGLNPIDALRYE